MNQNAAGSGEPDEVPDSGAGDSSPTDSSATDSGAYEPTQIAPVSDPRAQQPAPDSSATREIPGAQGAADPNPYGAHNPYAGQNPYGAQYPYPAQNPYGAQNPYPAQYPYSANNPYPAQNPYSPQQPYAAQPQYGAPGPYGGAQYGTGGRGGGSGTAVAVLIGLAVIVAVVVALVLTLGSDDDDSSSTPAMHSSPATLVSPSTEEPTWTTSTPTTTDYTGSGWIGTFVGTVPAAGGDAAGDTHTYIFTDDDPIDGRMIITGAIGGSCEYSLSQNSRTDATTASLHLTLINGDGCRSTDAEATLTGDTITLPFQGYTLILERR